VHTVGRVIVTTTDHDFVDVTVKPVTGVPAHSAARAAGGVGVKALAGRVKAAAATVVLGAGVVAAGAGLSQVPSVGATLTTTFHHPFYDQTQHAFVDAKDLQPGDILQTPDGTAAVTAVRAYHATRPTYDLTIDGLHTYYVVAGNAAVLVHNCGGDVYANGGRTRYGSLDNLGRPTGVSASIDRSMIRTGTPANAGIRPPGFTGGMPIGNQARGHLLGNQLGGSGDLPENLVTLTHNPTNSPVMRGFENQVRGAIENGETVQLSSTPIYNGDGLVPRGIHMEAHGSGGFCLDVCIVNPAGG
jgi:hypothetical protein